MERFYKYLATLGFVGYLPFAPGTFGSLAAAVFFFILKPEPSAHLLFFVIITAVGIPVSTAAEKAFNKKDSGHIVIDEFAGFCLSVMLIPHNVYLYIAAFFLFRFFDILKPPPIRYIERSLPGGTGIVCDDLMAGLYTNLMLRAWITLT